MLGFLGSACCQSAGGTARTATFPGIFAFYPTAGDCMNHPVTEFIVVRNAVLFS